MATITVPEALRRANQHWSAGQAQPAEQLCQLILQKYPNQPDACHLLGLMAHAYGQKPKALDYMRKACAAPNATYHSNLTEMCRQAGLLEEGIRYGRRAVSLDEQSSSAWNNLGIVLQEAGQYIDSRYCLEKAYALDPQNPSILNNLGNTCSRQRENEAAEKYWKRAIALKPDYAPPYSNLAKRFAEQSDYENAILYGRKAITYNPQLAEAYLNLSTVLHEQGDTAAALSWLDALMSFAPNHSGALSTKASLYLKLDQPENALAFAQKAVQITPQSAEAHFALGGAFHSLNQLEKAEEAFEKASILPGIKAEDGALALAILKMEQGDNAAAKEAFLAIHQRFPTSARALYSLADLKRFTADDPLIPEMETLLQAATPKEQTALHFALGKVYMDLKDAEKAFYHLNTGNQQKRQTFTYRAADTTQRVQNYKRLFSMEKLMQYRGKGFFTNAQSKPVFVVGMPRSGTTLVEHILSAHSAIAGAGELSALSHVVQTWMRKPDFSTGTLRQMGKQYLDKTSQWNTGTGYLVDKMPANLFYAGLIPLILPQAKIIYVRRNPIDTCLSCYTKLFTDGQHFSYQLDELALFAKDTIDIRVHWEKVIPDSQFMVVDYENLVSDFQPTVESMLRFLDLTWEPTCLDFHQSKSTVRTASVNQVRKPLYQSSVARWKPYADYLQPLIQILDNEVQL